MQLTTSRGRELLEAGRLAEAREQLWHEAQVAETEGDAVSFAAAALGLGGIWVHEHRSTLELARVVELQRRALGGSSRPTRCPTASDSASPPSRRTPRATRRRC